VSWATLPLEGGINSQIDTNKKQTVQPPEQDKPKKLPSALLLNPPSFSTILKKTAQC